jgi:xanthine/uracil permease
VRPTTTVASGLLIPAALLGLLGVVLLFLDVVATVKNRDDFLLALGTLVVIAVLLRLQRSLRHFYRRSPALVSLLVGVLVLAYIFLTNGSTNISAIVLSDVDIWLALVAFAIVLYSAIVLVRLGRMLRRGR